MIDEPACPGCGAASWRPIGTRTFRSADAPELPEYDQKRFRVLFELWQPGEKLFEIRLLACQRCALVLYAPRPTAQELDAKYGLLCDLDRDSPGTKAISDTDRWRARRLYREVRKRLPRRGVARILDYGGGDGRLMSEFVARGHRCFTVDWSPTTVKGVERLGSTLDGFGATEGFDLIVASHVLEHLAEPRGILERLRRLMTVESSIYVEVPLEIWGGPPRMTEPVTHVNFFVGSGARETNAATAPGKVSETDHRDATLSQAEATVHLGWRPRPQASTRVGRSNGRVMRPSAKMCLGSGKRHRG